MVETDDVVPISKIAGEIIAEKAAHAGDEDF